MICKSKLYRLRHFLTLALKAVDKSLLTGERLNTKSLALNAGYASMFAKAIHQEEK